MELQQTIQAVAEFPKQLRNRDQSFVIFLVGGIAKVLNKRNYNFDTNLCERMRKIS